MRFRRFRSCRAWVRDDKKQCQKRPVLKAVVGLGDRVQALFRVQGLGFRVLGVAPVSCLQAISPRGEGLGNPKTLKV